MSVQDKYDELRKELTSKLAEAFIENKALHDENERLKEQLKEGHHCTSYGMCDEAGSWLRAENERLKDKVSNALKELAHIEGTKTPTEIRIEQALKEED